MHTPSVSTHQLTLIALDSHPFTAYSFDFTARAAPSSVLPPLSVDRVRLGLQATRMPTNTQTPAHRQTHTWISTWQQQLHKGGTFSS